MKILFAIFFPLMANLSAGIDTNHITVQGSCEIKVTPDRGAVSFTAENQSKNQKEAVTKTNQQINQLKEKILTFKLNELEFKNTEYNVWPVREYEKDKYVDKGMRATLTLMVTTSDISRLGEAMASASEINIKSVGSLQTFLSEEKQKQTYAKCLDIAAEDAKSKAVQLSKRLGFKLGPVIVVNEAPASVQRPFYQERGMMKSMLTATAEVQSTQIEAGDQKFSTTIEVSFSIK